MPTEEGTRLNHHKIIVVTLLLLICLTGCQSNIWTGERILVTPAAATIKLGQSIALEVYVKRRGGVEAEVSPVWTVENPLGTLDQASGKRVNFTAQKVGLTRIKVTAHGLVTYAQITIVDPILTELTLSPSVIRMGLGQTAQLTLKAVDQFGDLMTISPTWIVTPSIGVIDANHRLTATEIGVGEVTVTAGHHSASLDLTVEAPVQIPDPGLRNALLHQLKKTDGNLFPYELEQITELTATQSGISDLTGLNYCIHLNKLDLEGNQITNLNPLSRLTALTDLNFSDNQIHDLAPLTLLRELRSLNVGNNPLVGLKPLEPLIWMERLDLSETDVDDLTDLYGMEMLQELYLSYCRGLSDDDLEVVIHMQQLKIVDLKGTFVSSLEPLKGLTSLTELDIRSAIIRDLSPLATCTALTTLLANDNGIRDITPLEHLTGLQRLNLSMNLVQDVTPLQGLVHLEMLYLAANQIEDIWPLVQNKGLGKGDQVDITENDLDFTEGSEDLNHLQTLRERGVIMIGF